MRFSNYNNLPTCKNSASNYRLTIDCRVTYGWCAILFILTASTEINKNKILYNLRGGNALVRFAVSISLARASSSFFSFLRQVIAFLACSLFLMSVILTRGKTAKPFTRQPSIQLYCNILQ
jgi:hypothetical protein